MVDSVNSREVQCLLLALKPHPTTGERDELRDAIRGEIDWTQLVEMALAHSVVGLLDRGLRKSCGDLLPEDIDTAFSLHQAEVRERNEALAAELLRIAEALSEAGIEMVPIKGPTQALQIYSDLALRSFRDLDMLVRWRDRARTGDVLRRLGYVSSDDHFSARQIEAMQRCNGQELFYSENANCAVEPHWDLFPNTIALDIDYDGLHGRSRTVTLSGQSIACLSKEDMFLVACLHGTKEQWWRLNWICDIAECLTHTNDTAIDWAVVLDRARAQRCLRAVLVGVGIANRVFDIPLPYELKQAIAADRRLDVLLDIVTTQKLNFTKPGPPDSFSKLTRIRFAVHEGIRRKAVYVLQTLFAPRPAHIEMAALPRGTGFLYYLLRPLHDYLLLPCWRLWKPDP